MTHRFHYATELIRYLSSCFHDNGDYGPAAVCGAFFIYISTDYVFDGRSPPYGEDDCPNPVNVYGRSKLEGERESLRHCPGTGAQLMLLFLF